MMSFSFNMDVIMEMSGIENKWEKKEFRIAVGLNEKSLSFFQKYPYANIKTKLLEVE